MAAGADAVGFVLYEKSRATSRLRGRPFNPTAAAFRLAPVLLFVNADASMVKRHKATDTALGWLQFHGDGRPAQCLQAAQPCGFEGGVG